MRFTKLAGVLCVGMLLLVPASGWGMIASNVSRNTLIDVGNKKFHLFFGASMHVENGDMTYTIQEEGVFKSELEWPLESIAYMGGIVSVSFLRRFQVNLGAWKSLSDEAGVMKDSDWFDELSDWLSLIYGDDKAIYGEFDATVDATQVDLNARYDFLRGSNIALGAMLGYSYTKWEWVTGDGYQISPLPNFNVGSVIGAGIIYEQELKVPYLGLALSLPPNKSSFGFNMYTLYSPIAQCDDVDDHLQRFKESIGKTEGTAFSLGGDILWKFSNSWSLTGKINYTSYDLEGNQDQVFYGGEDPPPGTRYDGIDMTVKGNQFYFGLMIGYQL